MFALHQRPRQPLYHHLYQLQLHLLARPILTVVFVLAAMPNVSVVCVCARKDSFEPLDKAIARMKMSALMTVATIATEMPLAKIRKEATRANVKMGSMI